jgi:hypothetical protein
MTFVNNRLSTLEKEMPTTPQDINRCNSVGMKRFMLSITEDMEKALEKERKKQMLGSIPETARVIIGEYLAQKQADSQ